MNNYFTYRVEQWDCSQKDADGIPDPKVIWDCGHKHREIRTAIKCMYKQKGTGRYDQLVIISTNK